jgi:hypothetical protein
MPSHEEKYLTIILVCAILTIGGCCTMASHYNAMVEVQRETTKQLKLQLQARIDSIQLLRIKQ